MLLNNKPEKHNIVKTEIYKIKSSIARKKRQREKAAIKVANIIKKWVTRNSSYIKLVELLIGIKVHGTAKETNLKAKLKGWRQRSVSLTKERDTAREQLKKIDDELVQLGLQLARVTEQEYSEVNATDEIVTGVLDLNKSVVGASAIRLEFLNRHVFPRLIGKDGKLVSQISFFSSNGLHKVVAMVNTMTLVVGDLAQKAQDEIEGFFKKFDNSHMDGPTKTMYDLTKQILVEKINFKIGPHLYRFLSLELDEDIFPELALAQRYLRQSIRYQKTNSYIRIYERKSKTGKFTPVPQS